MSAAGRFFVSPTAVEHWRKDIAPGCTEAEALADIIDWAEDAEENGQTAQGLIKYRARRPLRCYFLVAPPERGRTLPSIVAVHKPYPGWRPPSERGPAGGARPGAGRPKQEGRSPDYHCKLPQDCQDYIRSKPPGWLEKLIRSSM